MDGQMKGDMNGWTDGKMKGQMDGNRKRWKGKVEWMHG